jgi:hypothetical protein
MHNEELHNLYASPSIIRVIKSRKMRWSMHVARMGETRNAYNILVRKPKGGDHLEGLEGDGMIILEWILGKWGGRAWTGRMWLRIGATGELL